MKSYKDALYIAAREAYRREVVLPEMVPLVIGTGKDYATAGEWIKARVDEWLEDAAIQRSGITMRAADERLACDNFKKARDGKCYNCGCEQAAHR